MLKNFRYWIYPTKKQQRTLDTHLKAYRLLYDHLLQMRKTSYERDGISLSCLQQQWTYPVLKETRPSLRAGHSQVVQNIAVRVDLAFKAFFRRCKTGEKLGYPRFKGYGRYDSLTYPQSGFGITHDDRVCLCKIGTIKMVFHRPIKGTIKTCTVHRSSTGKWYVTFSVEYEAQRLPGNDLAVGIDVGLKTFAPFPAVKRLPILVSFDRRKRLWQRSSATMRNWQNASCNILGLGLQSRVIPEAPRLEAGE